MFNPFTEIPYLLLLIAKDDEDVKKDFSSFSDEKLLEWIEVFGKIRANKISAYNEKTKQTEYRYPTIFDMFFDVLKTQRPMMNVDYSTQLKAMLGVVGIHYTVTDLQRRIHDIIDLARTEYYKRHPRTEEDFHFSR
jgi:hypothetical protein